MRDNNPSRRAVFPYLLVAVMWLVLHVSLAVFHGTPVSNGELADTDGYMRLLRITQLLEGGDWFDGGIARSNAPYGEVLHWTRPFDVLLLLLAAPLAPFLGFDRALFAVGVAAAPLLQLATAYALIWATSPLLRPGAWFLPVTAFLLQPAVLAYSLPGMADHHALQLLVMVLALGFVFRALNNRFDHTPALLAGALAGTGLWLSIEFLPVIVACLAGLTFAWILSPAERSRQGLLFALGMVVIAGLALGLERPLAALFAVSYDRISVVHLLLLVLVLGFWAAVQLLEFGPLRIGCTSRAVLACGYGLAGIGLLYLLFPAFFAGPLVGVDPRIAPIWLDKVSEMQPVLPVSLKSLGEFVFYLSLGLFAAPFLAWLVWRERARPDWPSWCCLAFATAIFWPIAMLHVRFATFAEIVFVIAAGELVDRVLTRARHYENDLKRGLVRGLTITAFLVGPTLLGTQIQKASGEGTVREAKTGAQLCDLPEMARFLETSAFWPSDKSLTILAFLDFGPQLLYRTRHAVIATPYHRNAAGIWDSYRMLTTDAETARGLMQSRNVDLVLLCPRSPEEIFFVSEQQADPLYGRLVANDVPSWLEPLELPAGLAENFRLFGTKF